MQTPQEGEQFGLLKEKRFHVNLAADETFDNNIYLTVDNAKRDYITALRPLASAYYGNSDTLMYGSYSADILLYAINNKENRINQAVEGRIELFRNAQLKLRLSDTLRPTTDPATSETNEFVRRFNNVFNTNLRWDVSDKTSLELAYNQMVQNYISRTYENYSYMSHTASPILYWHMSAKTSITGEYNLGIIDYYKGTNYGSIYQQARAGIQGKLTPKSTVFLKAGYQFRYYESSVRKNVQTAVMEGVYDYAMSAKTTLEFLASYGINESVYASEGYFTSANFYAGMNHDISNNFGLNTSVSYVRSDYPNETTSTAGDLMKRSDNLYSLYAKATYQFRSWLSAYVGYELRIKNSDMRDFEYDNSRVSCGGSVSF